LCSQTRYGLSVLHLSRKHLARQRLLVEVAVCNQDVLMPVIRPPRAADYLNKEAIGLTAFFGTAF
jgi:hypothetical protein